MSNVMNMPINGYCIAFDTETSFNTATAMISDLVIKEVTFRVEYDSEGDVMTIFSSDKNSGLPEASLNIMIG